MILRADSFLLAVLETLANPTPLLPPLFPLWVERARVGQNYTDFVRVTLRRR
jgi:hypothetical protein